MPPKLKEEKAPEAPVPPNAGQEAPQAQAPEESPKEDHPDAEIDALIADILGEG